MFSAAGFAGHETGNGGGGVKCATGGQTTLQLLDLWEGIRFRGLAYSEKLPMGAQLAHAYRMLRNQGSKHFVTMVIYHSTMFEIRIKDATDSSVFLPDDIALVPPSDTAARYLPKHCELVGIAAYDDTAEQLMIDREYFDLLSEADKAGLILHEAVYKVLRDHYPTADSRLARLFTACLLSKQGCDELNADIPVNDRSSVCLPLVRGPGISEVLWDQQKNRLFISKVDGEKNIVKTFVDLKRNTAGKVGPESEVYFPYSTRKHRYWNASGYPERVAVASNDNGDLVINGVAFQCSSQK